MTDEITKPRKKLKESKPKSTEEQRLNALEKWREDVGKELRNLETLKLGLAEFVFQTVIIVISFFAAIIAIILGFTSQWSFDSETKHNLVLGLLILIILILFIWLCLWIILHFRKKRQ